MSRLLTQMNQMGGVGSPSGMAGVGNLAPAQSYGQQSAGASAPTAVSSPSVAAPGAATGQEDEDAMLQEAIRLSLGQLSQQPPKEDDHDDVSGPPLD